MCCELLSKPAIANTPDILTADEDLPIDCGKPTRTEIRKAIKQLMNSKVAGADVIPVEVLKLDHRCFMDYLKNLRRKDPFRIEGWSPDQDAQERRP